MSKPESEPLVPGPESPAATGADADADAGTASGTDADTGADTGTDTGTGTAADPAEAPTAGQDPRVDFRKDTARPARPVEHERPAAADESERAGRPEQAEPEPAPPAPADPWAAPDFSAGPPAVHPAAPAPVHPAAPAPQAVPPSAAPPQPPYPLPAGGWASVTPPARSGFPPGHPYAQAPDPGQGPAAPVPGYFPGPAPAPAPTNGFAVGSLVTGLLLVAPVALVFGILALVQINRRKERGSGMAVTGLVLGTIGTVLLAIGLGAADFSSARAGRFGQAPKAPAGSVHWSDLKAGDCYDSPDGGSTADGNGDETVYWVHRVACAGPHHGEVAGTALIPSGNGLYPGESAAREAAGRLCRGVLGGYALDQWAVPDGMDDVYLYPTAKNWASGARYVTCAYEDREDRHRGTVRTDRSRLTAPQLAYLEAARSFNDDYLEQPDGDVSEAEVDYRAWARRVASASRTEAAVLGRTGVAWPADVQPKIAKLAEAKAQAAAAWDAAASGTDLAGDLRKARAMEARTTPTILEIRRGLGLSTGEQAPDLRV
ncbi:DUF4190 domain-containing protein [Kitasatospora sp. NPDC005856]|uniref:DUF4190 domain-containing protein n=1 Tax=Kitasatospora sp. NPDC005856 TaxID=3154566 RepID=UPI0033EF22D5